MAQGVGDTVSDFWYFLQQAFGSSLAWVVVLVGLTAVALLFRGRIAARWVFPIVLVLGAVWAIRRWLWYYF